MPMKSEKIKFFLKTVNYNLNKKKIYFGKHVSVKMRKNIFLDVIPLPDYYRRYL